MKTVKMTASNKAAKEMRLGAMADVIATGNDAGWYMLLDWLEENGVTAEADRLRRFVSRQQKSGSWTGTTATGTVWFVEWAKWELQNEAQMYVRKETSFLTFAAVDCSSRAQGNDMTQAMNAGYVPTLSRSRPSAVRLGRICEALGYRVFWLGNGVIDAIEA